jgi:hypothetical protein
MRVTKPCFSPKFKPAPEIRHDSRVLTGFGGVTLFSGYLVAAGLVDGLRFRLKKIRKVGDYAVFSLVYLLLLFISVGGRRPGHLKYFEADGLLARAAWLRRIPGKSTVSRFFTACGKEIVAFVGEANVDFVIGCLRRLGGETLKAITLDVDGTVVSTRGHQGFAAKGYNPIKKGARSYRPLTVHVSETGQFIEINHRPGDAADNESADVLLRKAIRRLKREFPGVTIRVRMDSGFFEDKLLGVLEAESVKYVVVAKMYESLALVVRDRKRWEKIRDGVEAFEFCFQMKAWSEARDFVAYRFRLNKEEIAEREGEQLDLFRPNDPEYRYMLFCHNFENGEMPMKEMHTFYAGRCNQEKDIGQLKSGFAFDQLPSSNHSGIAMWQKLSMLAYNAVTGFALEVVDGATSRKNAMAEKATRLFKCATWATVRFLHLCVPGQLANDSGRTVLHLPESRARKADWDGFRNRIDKIGQVQQECRRPAA